MITGTDALHEALDRPAPIFDRTPLRPDELVGRAVEHRDPHVLKFTEACAREHAIGPNPVYLHAAQHVLAVTPAW
jgi:hypothetical protein